MKVSLGTLRAGRKLADMGGTPLSAVAVTLVCVFSTCLMLACGWWFGLRETVEPVPLKKPPSPEYMAEQAALHRNYRTFANTNSKFHDRPAGEEPLAVQSPLPPLDVEGWLNETLTADAISGKVLVVDVWDGICPYCSLAAPLLIKTHDKFSDDAVEFIGLTSADSEDARAYVGYSHITWPNAYGAGETIDALGANAPTLFVIGADGRVAWHDDSARYRHAIGNLDERLEAAIERALSAM